VVKSANQFFIQSMSFYRFNQISGRLAPTHQFKAAVPQGLTPANKLQFSEVRTNFPDMFRFRSTFNLVKQTKLAGPSSRGASSGALPTEFTITGFPKFPEGTKIGKKLVMGKYGPYSPKIRALQELMQKNPDVNIALKKGASDRLIYNFMIAMIFFQIFVFTPFAVYTLAIDAGPYKRLFMNEKKEG